MIENRTHPAPSPEGHDPHPAREETSGQTSPERTREGSPRMARELEDDRKLNGYVHDGTERTGGLAKPATGPAQPDAVEEPMTRRGSDGRVHETPQTEDRAEKPGDDEQRPVDPTLRMPPD